MAYIPAGSFLMGSAKDDAMRFFGEKSLVSTSTKSYCIDRHEAPGKGVMPRQRVSWHDAARACRQRGKRLCSEEEWERACKGGQAYRYPYGEHFDANACNTRDASGQNRSIRPSGSHARCRSPYGLFDMSGNVAEWTSSTDGRRPWRIVRGGAANRPDWDTRCASRSPQPPNTRKATIGFRCCRNAAN
jgi:formylglycine-generating enzyme required for sulfatase activity